MTDNFLNPENTAFLKRVRLYLGIIGGLLFLVGLGRIAVEASGNVRDIIAETSPELFSTETALLGGLFVLVGYLSLYSFAAVGAMEPPALDALRVSIIAIAITLIIATIWAFMVGLLYGLIFLILAVGASIAAYLIWMGAEKHALWQLFGQAIYRRKIGIMVYGVAAIAAVLLIALGLIYAILSDTLELSIAAEPNQLLYTTTFDAFNDEWDLPAGRESAEIVDGELILTEGKIDAGAGFSSVLKARRFRDFDLRVTARQVSGPNDNTYGVLFQFRDPLNYFHFQISGDGYYRFTKAENGILEEITSWASTDIIHAENAANEIRIVSRESEYTFYINGQQMRLCTKGENRNPFVNPLTGECQTNEWQNTYRDETFQQGHIGLSAGTTDATYDNAALEPVVIGFDNLVILGPADE